MDNGFAINDLSRYIQYLMRHSIILLRRRTRWLNINSVRSVTDYTCQEHRNGCNAKLKVYAKQDGRRIRVHSGQHNHGLNARAGNSTVLLKEEQAAVPK